MEDQYKNDNKEVKKLLKKLQETFLSPSSADAGNQKEDANDRKFREQLAKMLKLDTDLPTEPTPSEKKPRGKKIPKPIKQDKPIEAISDEPLTEPLSDEPLQEEVLTSDPILDEPLPEEETVEPIAEESAASAPPPPKKPRKKREPKPTKAVEPIQKLVEEDSEEVETIVEPEPIVEPETIEKPILEHPLDLIVPLEPEETIAETEPDTAPETVIEPKPILETEPVDQTESIEKTEPIEKPLPIAGEKPPITVFIPEKREPIYTEVADQLAIPVDDYLPQNADQPIVIRPASRRTEIRPRVQNGGIVIRPPAPAEEQSDKIVIAPGSIKRIPQEKPSVRRQIAEKPIKIGKEILPADQRKEIPAPAKQPKPIMKKEQNTTLVSSATAPETTPKSTTRVIAKGPATPQKKPGVTMPRSSGKSDTGSDGGSEPPRKEPKLKASTKKSGTAGGGIRKTAAPKKKAAEEAIPPLHEDDGAEEILEEPVIEEIPLDAAEETPSQDRQPLSPARRKLMERRWCEEETRSPMELVCKKSGLTEDDIVMMLELGYENDLGRLVGFDMLRRIKSDRMKTVSRHESKHYRTAFGYRGEEYVDDAQRDKVRAAFIKDRKRLILRTVLTAFAVLALILISSPARLGAPVLALHGQFPLLFPLVSILLLLGTALLSKRQINAGLRSMLKFEPTPYTVPSLLLPIALVYDIAALFAKSGMFSIDPLVASVLLLTAVCDAFRLSAELNAFRIISAEGEKTVLDSATPRRRKLRRGNKIVRIETEVLGENLYHVRSTNQCVGFFRRVNAMHSAARPFTVLLTAMLILSVAAALVTAVATDSLSSALTAFAAVLLTTAPLSALFSYFYPLCRANRLLYRQNAALLGEESVDEYSRKKTLIFDDRDLYSAKTQAEVSVEDGDILRSDLRLAGILFRKLGGALGQVGVPLSGGQADPPVSILRIRENGVEAMIDNSRHMLIGNAEFLRREGIRVPKESTDRILRRAACVALMYVAIDGVLRLGYEIEYQTNDKFEQLIAELADSGNSVAIRSYDPNLCETFLYKSRPNGTEPVQVIRPGRFEEDKPVELSDTGAVVLGGKEQLSCVLHAASAIKRLHRFSMRMQLIASILAGVAITALAYLGNASQITPASIAIYHLFWMLVHFIAARAELCAERLKLKK